MPDPSEARYNMRKNAHDEYWTVFDIFTGLPAEVNGNLMDALKMEEADDLVDLLNAQYVERRGGITH
ncbi:hypothetical protein HRR99_03120 [Agrobacterium vaccinii]|uniref:hypothetical protein n=1 Tax=Agrobacterium vaccinii TaxID=2735528 RepID=UPI001E490C6C|nr:hypothetical protein [Agrobacterium vaccinii]UHS60582.1 hypothetical protein HRR99_03120 [Agrobacterium vaccinii]